MVANLNVSKEKILQFLLVAPSLKGLSEEKGISVREIAQELELSLNVVHQYLRELEKDGLVVKEFKKRKKGRPMILYSLHERAMEFFPKLYVEFSLLLINEIEEQLGTKKTLEILSNIGKKLADQMKAKKSPVDEKNLTLEQRLQILIDVMDAYGKYPRLIENKDYYYIQNSNCLLYDVVKEQPLVCEVDHVLVDEILGCHAEKIKCIRDGDPYCLYRVKRQSDRR